jgi:hypothetical protein
MLISILTFYIYSLRTKLSLPDTYSILMIFTDGEGCTVDMVYQYELEDINYFTLREVMSNDYIEVWSMGTRRN